MDSERCDLEWPFFRARKWPPFVWSVMAECVWGERDVCGHLNLLLWDRSSGDETCGGKTATPELESSPRARFSSLAFQSGVDAEFGNGGQTSILHLAPPPPPPPHPAFFLFSFFLFFLSGHRSDLETVTRQCPTYIGNRVFKVWALV